MSNIILSDTAQAELKKLYIDYQIKEQEQKASSIALNEFVRIARQTLNVPTNYRLNNEGTAFIP